MSLGISANIPEWEREPSRDPPLNFRELKNEIHKNPYRLQSISRIGHRSRSNQIRSDQLSSAISAQCCALSSLLSPRSTRKNHALAAHTYQNVLQPHIYSARAACVASVVVRIDVIHRRSECGCVYVYGWRIRRPLTVRRRPAAWQQGLLPS